MLPADQTHLDWLENLGCHTLEHVRNLPREGVRLRCSPDIIRELDAAYGFTVEPCSWFKAPEIFSQRYDPQEYLEHVHAVQAVATKLIEQLCAWLDARQCAADTLVFLLHHEKGRHARPPSRLLLLLSRAGWRSRCRWTWWSMARCDASRCSAGGRRCPSPARCRWSIRRAGCFGDRTYRTKRFRVASMIAEVWAETVKTRASR